MQNVRWIEPKQPRQERNQLTPQRRAPLPHLQYQHHIAMFHLPMEDEKETLHFPPIQMNPCLHARPSEQTNLAQTQNRGFWRMDQMEQQLKNTKLCEAWGRQMMNSAKASHPTEHPLHRHSLMPNAIPCNWPTMTSRKKVWEKVASRLTERLPHKHSLMHNGKLCN